MVAVFAARDGLKCSEVDARLRTVNFEAPISIANGVMVVLSDGLKCSETSLWQHSLITSSIFLLVLVIAMECRLPRCPENTQSAVS